MYVISSPSQAVLPECCDLSLCIASAIPRSCGPNLAKPICLQNKKAPQEEFDSKLADLKKELGYWESYLGSNEYVAGSQFSLAGDERACCVCVPESPHTPGQVSSLDAVTGPPVKINIVQVLQ